MSLVVEDIRARSDALRARLAALVPDPTLGEDADIVEAVRATVHQLLPPPLPPSPPSALVLAHLRAVVSAEQVAAVFSDIRAQRRSVSDDLLLVADAAAADGYRHVLQAALALGARSDGLRRWPRPLVTLTPMPTPATFVRGRVRDGVPLPFPIVMIPAYAGSISALTLVQHEIGHDLDEDLGLTTALKDPLANALRAARASADVVRDWVDWLREIVADTLGAVLAGSPLAAELAEWAPLLPGDSTTHPPTSLRVEWVRQCLEKLGAGDLAASVSTIAPPEALLSVLPVALSTVLESPLEGLGGNALRDLATGLGAQERQLTDACRARDPQGLPPRLVASYARLARHAEVDPATIRASVRDSLNAQSPAVRAPFRFEAFRRQVLDHVTPPILVEEELGLKRPPTDLFDRVRDVSFVGATNDSLPALFEKYLARGLPTKDRVEVFFLTDRAARSLAHTGRSADDLSAGRARNLAALPRFAAVAREFRIYEHEQPFYFASYWDAALPGGRIHVSPHGWGQDVTRAPAMDYVWSEGTAQATRTYRFYQDALTGLRARASRVGG